MNNRDRNFTRAKVERRRAQLEQSVARYLSQLDTADLQEPSETLTLKTIRLREKLAKLKEEMGKLAAIEKQMLASPDQQISLTDPDSRSMATSGRGYFNGAEILACHEADITVTLPKPMTSGAKSEGRFGKQDFVYLPYEDVYRCPAGERLTYRYTNVENGQTLRRYWTNVCQGCVIKNRCTTGKERRIASCDALRRPERRPRLHDPPGWGRQASRLPARGRARPRTRFAVARRDR